MLRLEILSSATWSENILEPWRTLFESCREATPFQSPEWIRTWWQVYGPGKKPRVLCWYSGNDLVGIFPLAIWRWPWRAIRAMGTGNSDYLGPLCAPGFESMICASLAEFLAKSQDFDLVDLHQIRDRSALAGSLETWPHHGQAECPVLELPSTFEDYLKLLGKSLRYDVNKGFRREPDIRTAATPEEALKFLQIFVDLHESRWKNRGLPGAFRLPKTRAFHEFWVQNAVQRGQLCLSVLFDHEQPIGALYAMAAGDSTFFYQSGFAPEAKSLSPGTVLVANAIRNAIEQGHRTFDFLRGAEPYKLRWQPQETRTNLRFAWAVRGPLGPVGIAVNRAEARIEASLRARLEGRGLVR